MNSIQIWASRIAIAAATLSVGASIAQASTTQGKVTFVGTVAEEGNTSVGFSSRMRIRVNGTCDTDSVAKDRWIVIRSGRTDGVFAHNGITMRNAYNTLTAALLSGKNVQIDAMPNCSTTAVINLDLWAAQIGIY